MATNSNSSGSDWSAIAGLFSGFGTIGSAISQSNAYQAQGQYDKYLSEINSRLADQQFQQVIKKGEEEATAYSKKVKGLAGSQKAALAAQGIDVGSGSAAEIQKETMIMGAEDAMKIRNNAYQEAFGYKVQAINTRSQGNFDSMTAGFKSRQTLLSGGMQAAGEFAESYGKWK
jgi:hypothetical protein